LTPGPKPYTLNSAPIALGYDNIIRMLLAAAQTQGDEALAARTKSSLEYMHISGLFARAYPGTQKVLNALTST